MSEKISASSINAGKTVRNMAVSVLAQVISLLTSFIVGLIVPKFIPELEYSYWQMYVLYVSYVGVLHFGLLDGIVLRYAKYNYDELDKPRVRSQFQLLVLATSFIGAATTLVTIPFTEGAARLIVPLVCIGMVTKNIVTYTFYTYQITNRINQYALLVIAQRMTYACLVTGLLLLRVQAFYWYCIADLCSDIIGFLISIFRNKGLYFRRGLPVPEVMREAGQNISCGIMLLIANFSSNFLVGGAKMMIQWHWDVLIFGKVSFAFSVSNLFLSFVSAVSIVLFPSLKRMREEELPDLYGRIRQLISPLLFFVMLFYFPLCKILAIWLPKYEPSLLFLGILLPIIVFSSKVSLLTNNYLKAYRKEKHMLVINVVSVVCGMALFALCAYGLDNLELLLYGLVLMIMVRSVASEIAVSRVIERRFVGEYVGEALMTVGFIACVRGLSLWIGCAVYASLFVIYLFFHRKTVKTVFQAIGRLLKK